MGIFARRTVDRLRRRATSEQKLFDACVRAGDAVGALRHSDLQERAIAELVEREPGENFHRFQLAGVLYNRATVLDAMGLGGEAVDAGRRAVETYATFDPVGGASSAVQRQLRELRADGFAAETLIRHTADARARLARLLAKYEGSIQADAVHRHGKAAIETYEGLLRHGTETTQADLDRVTAQYEAAREHLRRPAKPVDRRQPAKAPKDSRELKATRDAITRIERTVAKDPTGVARVANRSALARLHYDQAALHNNIGNGPEAVQAARTAERLYTDVDPTHGDPARVEAAVREFRRLHPGSVDEFEALIGDAANARSQLAWMLACHHGAPEADTVERLGTKAIRTYEQLVLVSRTYGPDDLRLVAAQVAQALALLRR
ncbi:hypothetical protein GCM10011609_09950 [Lentzea pudingi]|uniref:Tetratricopeptide repeat protein n=1 Tax=Lentzea pudingi TaxID=1789439 RepID=A0ABQ2HDM2_9PSEU|nr:hypothetical protein [Lentzea pudingi]GGM76025.1 hypothetical protein GCM10011609_09950 [Lentzea pudingi]